MDRTVPIYEYQCEACGKVSEAIRSNSSAPPPAACPKCGTEGSLGRIMSQTNFKLKGGGWYVTDYGSKEAAPAKESGESSPSSPAAAEKTKAEPTSAPKSAPKSDD